MVSEDCARGLVSAIIPTYNRAALVGRAIESALRQSYPDVEIIVVDDGSTDETPEVVASFGPAVRYLRQRNAGVAAARNHGFRESRGEYVALLDSDDAWLPWKIDAQVRILQRFPEVGMVWTDMTAVDDKGDELYSKYLSVLYDIHEETKLEQVCRAFSTLDVWPEAPDHLRRCSILVGGIFPQMLLGNHVHTPTVLLRRSRLARTGGFDESFRVAGEDYEFHLRTCAMGDVALWEVPSTLYRIDGGDDQITSPQRLVHMARANLVTVERWLDNVPDDIELDEERITARLAEAHGWIGEEALRSGNAAEARTHLLASLRLGRLELRRLAMLALSSMPSLLRRAVLAGWRARRIGR